MHLCCAPVIAFLLSTILCSPVGVFTTLNILLLLFVLNHINTISIAVRSIVEIVAADRVESSDIIVLMDGEVGVIESIETAAGGD